MDENGAIDELHFESPHLPPDSTTPVLLAWETVNDRIIKGLEPERSQSLEIITSHLISRNRVGALLQGSFSYNMIDNLFLWNQDFFRRVNIIIL